MLFNRIVIWPILIFSYGAVFAAAIHTIMGNWSGAASLGMAFAVLIGCPCLVGYAGYLWRKNLLHGSVRAEATLCVMLPISILLLVAVAFGLGR